MKKYLPFICLPVFLLACGTANQPADKTTRHDSVQAVQEAAAKPQNCQSLVASDKLGKTDEYSESAKNIKVNLTLLQDETTMDGPGGCYHTYAVEVLARKKSGSQVFKRKLLRDDLLHFTKEDDVITQSILQKATYIPTFNSQKYITIGMELTDPTNKKNTAFTVFLNYYGEIVKVKR